MNVNFEELKASGNLPSPSGVALEILRLTQQPDVGVDDLVRPVQSDPALCGRLLKIANSAQFGLSFPVISVRDALIRVGTLALARLALSLSVLDSNRNGACQAFDYDHFWSSSLLRALAMQALAQQQPVLRPEEAFSVGLISEIGRLALAQIYPQEYAQCLLATHGTLLQREQDSFLINHQQVSVEMLRDWGIPEAVLLALCQAWASALCEPEALDNGHTLALQLQLASILAGDPSLDQGIGKLQYVLQALQISNLQFEELRNQLFLDWRSWGELLCVPTGEIWRGSGGTTDAGDGDRLRILLVEDDRTEAHILSRYLGLQGHQVMVASDGHCALRQLIAERPQIVITDYHMSPMDGLGLTRALRASQESQSVYIILITAEKDAEIMSAAFDAGVNDFISKPINQAELNARVIGARRVLQLQMERLKEQELVRRRAFELASAKRRIEKIAVTDQLTGLPNRHYANSRLDQEWAVFVRHGSPLLILSLDLDRFKAVNDDFGHDTGDRVLQHFASVLRQTIRAEDTACRMGGEEFVVIAPNTDSTMVATLCERIRASVEQQQPGHLNLPRLITVSIGAAVADSALDRSWSDTLKRSDLALYDAKNAGRNTFCIASLAG